MSRLSLRPGTLVAWSAVAITAIVAGWSLPIDDFWLSIASGRAIADGERIDAALPFSWTDEVRGALNPQWGAQVLLGAHGSVGVALALNAGLLAAGIGLTVLRAARRTSGMAVAVALLLILVALAPHLLARAQSFSIALLPLALILMDRYATRPWLPFAYGVLMVAWANLHGGFVIGQVAAVVWLVAAVVQRRSPWVPAGVVVAAAVSPLANPAGPALLAYAYGQPATSVVTSISVEWQPSWPWIAVAMPFWAILLAFVAGRFIGGRLPRFSPLRDHLLAGVLALLAISAIRHIPWFLLTVLPILAADFDQVLTAAPRLAQALGRLPRPLAPPRVWRTLAVLGVLVLAFQIARPALPVGLARLTPDEPAAAVDQLELLARDGDHVLNEQVWGGYLAHRLWPRVETAMDGRLEIRSRDEWASYFTLMQGRDDPAGALAARGVRWAIIGSQRGELRSELEHAGWSVIADDGYATLLRAPSRQQQEP